MKFIINSNINYYKVTFERVCNSLISSGADPSNIYFIVGGFNKYRKVDNALGVHLYEASHSSFDNTALISIFDLGLESDYWFFLHDTVELGTNFYSIVMSKYDKCEKIPLTSEGASNNIGSFSFEYLLSRKDEIMSFRNTDYSPEAFTRLKYDIIIKEDYLVRPFEQRHTPPEVAYNNSPRFANYNNPIDYYDTGVMRVIEYYPDVDLYKIKANWSLSDSPVTNL